MDFFKKLPKAVQIATIASLSLIVLFLVYSTMFKAPAPVEVIKTENVDTFGAAKNVLKQNGVEFTEGRSGSAYIIEVSAADETRGNEALGKSAVRDRTGEAKAIKCPAAPGFTATRAANERADNCAAAKAVQGMLLTAGADAANVQVSQEENGTLLGPEKSMNVLAQVFLPERMKDTWNAEMAAKAISRSVGTTVDRVIITDDGLQTLFDGSSSTGAGGADKAAAIGSLGCGDIATATEVETKKDAVRNCYETTIGEKLTKLLGGSDRFVLAVEPTIDSIARTTTTKKNTKGPVVDMSTQSGSGSSVRDETTPPNTVDSVEINPAGDISSMRITVTLDSGNVTTEQMLAVTSLLAPYVDLKRGDPKPTVKMTAFTGGAGDKPASSEIDQIRKDATAAAGGTSPDKGPLVDPAPAKTPKWMVVLMLVLVVGTATAVLILWRRSKAVAAEREKLEASFQQEQRLFENFAQQNPDDLAKDLNALFGAPSAPEPHYS